MKTYFVYITTSNVEEARYIGKTLVKERLAACINIIEPMTSIYWWEDKIHEDKETILIAKTTKKQINYLQERVLDLHSYDCPCITAMQIETGNPEYLRWINESTS